MAPINTTATENIYRSLIAQLDKLARHNRQGSFRTKERYYEACKRFCKFLAEEYHLQKLENLSGKHLVSYVEYLQEQHKSGSTVKTDLPAIRFFHDKLSNPKYSLPSNSELGIELQRRIFGQEDRTWSVAEFNRMLGFALEENRYDYILALYFARYAGLRIIKVKGATGLANTNYEGKAQAAIEALKTDDFVFVHVEATDEAGHDGDLELKLRAIDYLDKRLIRPILEAIDGMDEPVCVALLPDHPTPVELRVHVSEPVPFVIWHRGIESDDVQHYDEQSCALGSYGLLRLQEFMEAFMRA